uniref:Uncharacterized protein n=1 Tax=Glossina palpalis gambiensis TaxID=67801 RepID=A0A1B0BI50_9MUSC
MVSIVGKAMVVTNYVDETAYINQPKFNEGFAMSFLQSFTDKQEFLVNKVEKSFGISNNCSSSTFSFKPSVFNELSLGESVISTPILDKGEPTGPIENGITYIMRFFMQPGKRSLIALCISSGDIQFPKMPGLSCEVTGTACSFSRVHIKVRDSTLATSAGLVRANQQFSYLVKGIMVLCFSISCCNIVLSSMLPSQMCIFAGWQRSAQSST